jgi:hypothetical protein
MAWNASLLDGPVPIAIYGEPVTNDEGLTYRPVIGHIDGYHVNIAPQVYTAEMEPYLMTPTVPRRVFAGAETVFLRFADEAEARSVLGAYWMEPTE